MRANQILEQEIQREQAAPELAKQVRERNRKAADGGLHAVDRAAHPSRKQEAAAGKQVAKPAQRRWQPGSKLPGMPVLPGYYLEYVRRDDRTVGDHRNLRKHLREQWEIARSSDFEEEFLPTITLTAHGECIGNDDTILMKLPEELWAQRQAYYHDLRDGRTAAISGKRLQIDANYRQMPVTVTENNTESGFRQHSRRPVAVAPD